MTKDEQTILEAASRLYPVTVEELKKEVRMRPGAFDLAMRGMVNKGLVQLEGDRIHLTDQGHTLGSKTLVPETDDFGFGITTAELVE